MTTWAISLPFLAKLGIYLLAVATIVHACNWALRWFLNRPTKELSAHPDDLPLDITVDEDLDSLIVQAEPTPEPSQLIVREGWDREAS